MTIRSVTDETVINPSQVPNVLCPKSLYYNNKACEDTSSEKHRSKTANVLLTHRLEECTFTSMDISEFLKE